MTSVLQPWVMELPLRAQGTLLTGVRGCDLTPKHIPDINERYGCSTGESTPERRLVAYLRWCFMVPADPRETDIPGSFFISSPPCDWKPSALGHYPLHWASHLMHCYEVIGYCHPTGDIAHEALGIYERLAHSLHLNPETQDQFMDRILEDRIAMGNVVS